MLPSMGELRAEMFQVAVGYWLSKALFCAAKAGVADQLKAGPKRVDELASIAAVDSEDLYRLLRALASIGIFEETELRVMSLSPKAEYLRADHPQSMKHFALMVNDDLFHVWQKSAVFDRAMQEIHGGGTQPMFALS